MIKFCCECEMTVIYTVLSRDDDRYWVSATCTQRVNESTLVLRGAKASHGVLRVANPTRVRTGRKDAFSII